MMYRVGDKVKIREDLSTGSQYHDIEIVTGYMLSYAGKTTTIKEAFENGTYFVDCDNEEWLWPEKTLFPVNRSNAGKIRRMSDEELAKFLSEFSACECCNYKDEERDACEAPKGFVCVKEYAEAIIGDWLKKPAK